MKYFFAALTLLASSLAAFAGPGDNKPLNTAPHYLYVTFGSSQAQNAVVFSYDQDVVVYSCTVEMVPDATAITNASYVNFKISFNGGGAAGDVLQRPICGWGGKVGYVQAFDYLPFDRPVVWPRGVSYAWEGSTTSGNVTMRVRFDFIGCNRDYEPHNETRNPHCQ